MNSKAERFYNFIKSEKTQGFIAFILYILFIVMYIIPVSLQFIYVIVSSFILCPVITIYMVIWGVEREEKKFKKNIIQTIKRLIKEISVFIPFLFISGFILSFIIIGEPTNQASVDAFANESIYNIMIVIFAGPIFEEFVFRLLPYKFLKNKTLYITISAFLFAGIHVINYPNPLYYIWLYMPNALYYGYWYHKTNDLLVTISLHSLNNLLSMLPVILSYF